jgi:hypothetical protein
MVGGRRRTGDNMNAVRPGQKFLSRVWLDPNTNKPATMKITKVEKGSIYYRPVYGTHDDGTEWLGSPARIDNTPDAIAKWLEVTS